ncbi:MAG: long-chain fatty acid--CoA ligase, partial [Alphaproteobacteria bacterium]|nr:long-chain fatty acid--CoA ligase [Alphaproteobacteria bacterium]
RDTQFSWLKHYPEHLDWHRTYEPRAMGQLLDEAVRVCPELTCTNFLGKKLTYSELGRLVARAAAGWQQAGIKKGSKVGLLLPNSPTYIVHYFALLKLGAIVVNYNPLYTVDELREQVLDSGTDVMVTLDLKTTFEKAEKLIEEGTLRQVVVGQFTKLLPTGKGLAFRVLNGGTLSNTAASPARGSVVDEADLLDNDGTFTPADIVPLEDIAVFQYTGGTTGTPKGAMLTHANLSINVEQVCGWAPELTIGQERMMAVLPFFHVFAMTVVMNFAIRLAAELVIMPRFVLGDALKLIHKTRPTIMPGVPTLFNAIMNHQKLASYDLSSLKFCLSGGAALPLEVKNTFERLTGCTVVEGYGLSETSPVLTCNPLLGPVKENSIGLPFPQTILTLRDINDPTREVPLGEEGEICVAGPQVMKGYWNKPEETANAFVGEFFRTGDVAVMDEDGFFYIVDRIKDLIICSGYNVYPRRIEEVLYQHPAVEEVTVIGIADPYRGETPKAYVKLIAGRQATESELLEFAAVKLSKLEVPTEIEFRDELPKTLIGKLSKKELKQETQSRTQG